MSSVKVGSAEVCSSHQTSELAVDGTGEVALTGGDGAELDQDQARSGGWAASPSSAYWRSLLSHYDLTTSRLSKLRLQLTTASRSDHPEPPSKICNHVCAVPCSLHYEAAVAAALGEAPLQLVLQRRRLQAAWTEVRSPRDGWRVEKSGKGRWAGDCRKRTDGLTAFAAQGR